MNEDELHTFYIYLCTVNQNKGRETYLKYPANTHNTSLRTCVQCYLTDLKTSLINKLRASNLKDKLE